MRKLLKDPARDLTITGLLAYLITYSGFFIFDQISQLICTFLGMALVIVIALIWIEGRMQDEP